MDFPFLDAPARATNYTRQIDSIALTESVASSFPGFIEVQESIRRLVIFGTSSNDNVRLTQPSANRVRVSFTGLSPQEFDISQIDEIQFTGYQGDDLITNQTPLPLAAFGHSGNDILTGGTGNDFLVGGTGDDLIFGGPGNDHLIGMGGNDKLLGNAGDDLVFGARGNDILEGNDGNDVLVGDAGNDFIVGGNGNDLLIGWTDADRFFGGSGADVIHGQQGNDFIRGGPGNDTLFGGSDDDNINGESGNDSVFGDAGKDSLGGGAGNDLVAGGDGDDVAGGGEGNDRVFGNNGDDTLNGGKGHDELFGENGNDKLNGDAGNDSLFGQSDDDELQGGLGVDQLDGGPGSDYLNGGAANFGQPDHLTGGSGIDRIVYFSSDLLRDRSPEDSRIRVENSGSNWNDAELRTINFALKKLQQATGNSRLSKDYLTGQDLHFVKSGRLSQNAAAINQFNTRTWKRTIRVSDWNETNNSRNYSQALVFIHEISHNWDSNLEMNVAPGVSQLDWNQFLAVGTWRSSNPGGSGWRRSLDGQWYLRATAQFARYYGAVNPAEDWATVWELHFNDFAAQPAASSNLGRKLAVVRNLFAKLS